MLTRRHIVLLLIIFGASRYFPGPRAAADWNSPTITTYGVSSSDTPQSRRWNYFFWASPSSIASLSAEPYWCVGAGCPNRDEIANAFIDRNKRSYINILRGGTWSGAVQICANVGTEVQRPMDLAYEDLSGRGMVAYYDDTNSRIGYRTFSASGVSSELQLARPTNLRARYLRLVSRPQTNELVLLYHTQGAGQLHAAVWNGSAWGSWTTLASSTASASLECFSIAFEQLSGDGLVVYSDGATTPKYRTWNGAAWSAQQSMPATGTVAPVLIRLAADPTGDRIAFSCLDGNKRISANVWSGTSWSSNFVAETSAIYNDRRQFDVAFTGDGSHALLVYGESGSERLKYRTYTGSWSSEQNGADLNANVRLVSLYPDAPGDVIFIATSDDAGDLNISYWFAGIFWPPSGLAGSLSAGGAGEPFTIVTTGRKRFTDVSAATGFAVNTSDDFEWSSGLHWGDLDNDGDLDAFITGNAYSRLAINNGGAFSMSTFGGGGIYRQAALADVDNDGDLDIWCIPHYSQTRLYLNNGSATFTSAGNAGFNQPSNNEGMAAADVNRDGWCDAVYFAQNGNWIGHNSGAATPAFSGTVAASYGMNGSGNFGNGDYCSSGDVNNDGCLDFFYHWGGGKLFRSNGDGTFTAGSGGISVVTGENDKCGSAWADYDNDGDLDLLVTRERNGSYRPYLWRNSNGSFTDVASSVGLDDSGYMRGCCWGDYDNDGDLDLYIVRWGSRSTEMYRNSGAPSYTFSKVDEGATRTASCHDAVFVDYDNDGDLDLAVTRESDATVLFRNNTNSTSYLKVRLIGKGQGGTNAAAVGVRIELWSADGSTFLQRRDIGTARGFGGSEPLWAHFGGVNPALSYLVRVYFHSSSQPHETIVIPAAVSTTIGPTTIPQMITIEETASRKRVLRWSEVAVQSP